MVKKLHLINLQEYLAVLIYNLILIYLRAPDPQTEAQTEQHQP